ncbi:hypothetical protein TWF694_011571 [Orbilia ellipsospora]|uniref:Rpr2-domain-containing protein n=1 Tax=Orbilia ellipsospora TaxID=2528407 RepID=A0AAV9X5M8_9PEZI
MAKKGNQPQQPPPPQRPILSRLSFLHQASSILSLPQHQSLGLSRYYTSHLLAVSKKSVQRLSPSVKHPICKRCSSTLTPGVSCTTRIENKSKNGRKPWADILVIQCNLCKASKRFPLHQRGDPKNKKKEENNPVEGSPGDDKIVQTVAVEAENIQDVAMLET